MRHACSRLLPGLLAVLLCAAASAPAPVGAATSRAVPRIADAAYPHPPDLSGVACPSARVCYAVGYYGVQYHGTIVATTDAGRHWRSENPATPWGLRDIACVTVATCYAVGYAETSVVTTNGGRSWRHTHTAQSHQAFARVACPTSRMCVAAGNSPDGYIALVHRILLTTNGARTWSYPHTPIDRTAFPMNAVACPSARVCYAVGNHSTILATRDGGRSWQVQHNALMDVAGITPSLTGIACPSVRECVAVGGISHGVTAVTHDGGRTWATQTGVTHFTLTDVACGSARVCYAVGYYGTLAQTTDGGRTWDELNSGTREYLSAIACHGAGFCVVVGTAGYIGILHGPLAVHHAAPTPTVTVRYETPTPAPSGPTATDTPTAQPVTPPTATPTAGSSCNSWNVSGSWNFVGDTVTTQNGSATLQQSGSSVTGTLTEGGVTWTLSGNISGSTLTLTWSATGQVDQSYTGTVSSDGTTITGNNLGNFTGGHATCQR